MARARNIKPGFFINEDLVELPFSTRLLFAGLWIIADREGRLGERDRRSSASPVQASGTRVVCQVYVNCSLSKGEPTS